ncbi:hypothetical protein EDC96DRAFT_497609 [Choanephora cucurbitarum]|nr:hypothetical protein EDC96DRAFT_497609 [Choanephora cucurbitarum]
MKSGFSKHLRPLFSLFFLQFRYGRVNNYDPAVFVRLSVVACLVHLRLSLFKLKEIHKMIKQFSEKQKVRFRTHLDQFNCKEPKNCSEERKKKKRHF